MVGYSKLVGVLVLFAEDVRRTWFVVIKTQATEPETHATVLTEGKGGISCNYKHVLFISIHHLPGNEIALSKSLDTLGAIGKSSRRE